MRAFAAVVLTAVAAWCAVVDVGLLPKTNLTGASVVASHLLGPRLEPGGVVGNYKDARGTYQLLLARLPSNDKAAFLLLDIKKTMTDAHYLAHMGGFAGKKDGQDFYVFAKGPFVAAVAGRPEADADRLARIFAARLPLR